MLGGTRDCQVGESKPSCTNWWIYKSVRGVTKWERGQYDRLQKSRASRPWRSVGETDSNHAEWWAWSPSKRTPLYHQLTPVIKWTFVPWVMVKCMLIKIVYLTANAKHTRPMSRTLQLALPARAKFIPNRKSHTFGSRSGSLQPLLGGTKASDMVSERWRRSQTFDSA